MATRKSDSTHSPEHSPIANTKKQYYHLTAGRKKTAQERARRRTPNPTRSRQKPQHIPVPRPPGRLDRRQAGDTTGLFHLSSLRLPMSLAAKRIRGRKHAYFAPPPIPTRDEVRKLLNETKDAKTRAAVALMIFSGLKASDIQWLTIKDVPDLKAQGSVIKFIRIPAKIIPRRRPWPTFTFLCRLGCEYLQHYLEERYRKGERFTPKSPIIRGAPISLRRVSRATGINCLPLTLRAYFKTQLTLAEHDGLIPRDVREFISGYAVKEPLMPRHPTPQMEQMMRDAYRKSADKYLIP